MCPHSLAEPQSEQDGESGAEKKRQTYKYPIEL